MAADAQELASDNRFLLRAQQQGLRVFSCLEIDATREQWVECEPQASGPAPTFWRTCHHCKETFDKDVYKRQIADGRGICAAFALGAEGVQMGTRFLTVAECSVAQAYKDFVIKAKDSDTLVIGRGSGHPVRCLKNKFSRQVKKLEADLDAHGDEIEQMHLGALRRAVSGDVEQGNKMCIRDSLLSAGLWLRRIPRSSFVASRGS